MLSAEELNRQANEHAQAKRYDAAIALYHRALEVDPSLAKVYGNLGAALALAGRAAEAEPILRDGLARGGTPKLAGKLAAVLVELGRPQDIEPAAAAAPAEHATAMREVALAHWRAAGDALRAGAAALAAFGPRVPEDLVLELAVDGGGTLVVPHALSLITPFVLLEQGDWFEDELRFVRRVLTRGDRAIDVGANFGVYTLAMGRAVGPEGRVVAYEPSSATSAFLRETVRRNALANVEVVQAALSSARGEAEFANASSPELSGLGATSKAAGVWTERVALETLEDAVRRAGDGPIALLKLDAEGEELRILEGGSRSLRDRDPLLMTEVRHGEGVNRKLVDALEALGFSLFRFVPGLEALAPLEPAALDEPFLLNAFACSAARAALLRARGLIADAAAVESLGAALARARAAPPTAAALLARTRAAADLGWRREANEAAAAGLRAGPTPTEEIAFLEYLLRRKRYSAYYEPTARALAEALVALGDPHGHARRVLAVLARAGR
ncbi:MAG: FkbM family methyltransferase [Polyangiaceae bacterium]